ncbi:hypothetical protein [Aquamicrobium defluvii]|uniref:Uncharacterized protein n=1 Tax=Aquamicrobium defluvii TaxID=69279 RepID=A0A011V326_9HYPH|nr:hypothetical protein [Aquamicrobium defluvii]EXL02885.1 hypothetical protein BG36_13500 [Aquamicrobium defluvii]EZQ13370.1 hypothetical protein CF98_28340 [Halopseudomonas bauzanensis]
MPIPVTPAGSAAFIVVPPNGPAYADPAVIDRLEAFVLKRFPLDTVEVARVVQPRIESFTVVCWGPGAGSAASQSRRFVILAALEDFAPHAPEAKPD